MAKSIIELLNTQKKQVSTKVGMSTKVVSTKVDQPKTVNAGQAIAGPPEMAMKTTAKKKMGRPTVLDGRAMTDTERKRRWREKKRNAGQLV